MTDRFFGSVAMHEQALMDLGAALAPNLRAGDVLALTGDLGVGKTTFCRGLICALMGEVEVPSPTYTLVQTYEVEDYELWHCDLYRLETPSDILELGVVDMEADIVSLIEWPEKMGTYLSPDALRVDITFHDEGRRVSLSGSSIWAERLKGLSL